MTSVYNKTARFPIFTLALNNLCRVREYVRAYVEGKWSVLTTAVDTTTDRDRLSGETSVVHVDVANDLRFFVRDGGHFVRRETLQQDGHLREISTRLGWNIAHSLATTIGGCGR